MKRWSEKTGKEKLKTTSLFFLLMIGLLWLLVSPVEVAPFVSTIILLVYLEIRIRRRKTEKKVRKEYDY